MTRERDGRSGEIPGAKKWNPGLFTGKVTAALFEPLPEPELAGRER